VLRATQVGKNWGIKTNDQGKHEGVYKEKGWSKKTLWMPFVSMEKLEGKERKIFPYLQVSLPTQI